MGSWNETCMITNLPITYGDRVKFFLLKSKGTKSVPLFYPISGLYDDYGGIEFIDQDWNYHFVTEFLKEKNQSIDNVDNFRLEDFLEAIVRETFKVKYNTNEDSELSYVMIRGDIWNGIIENQINLKLYWDEENNKEIDAKTYCNKKIEKSINTYQKWKVIDKEIFFEQDKHPYFTNEYILYFLNNINTNNQFKKDNIEFFIINYFLESIRKTWMIQPGKGSQNSNIEPYLLLCDIIKKVTNGFRTENVN